MKRQFIIFLSLSLMLSICVNAQAGQLCTNGNSQWESIWTDPFGETTYSLTAPCKVYLNEPFKLIAAVSDPSYLNDWVASSWSISDNNNSIDNGFMLWTESGLWGKTFEITYRGNPIDHQFAFSFIDNGHGGGAHHFTNSTIGDTTVDPIRPVPEPSTIFLLSTGVLLISFLKKSY